MSSEELKKRLEKVKTKTKSPTEALHEMPIPEGNDVSNDLATKRNKRLSDLMDDTPKVEETHSRRTFLVENDLLKELDEIAEKQKRGFITSFINYAIESALNDYKQLKEK